MADFGNFMYDTIYTSGCPPPPPVFGCMDSSYVEFNLAATLDTGMCITPKIFGCTDSLAYNYFYFLINLHLSNYNYFKNSPN